MYDTVGEDKSRIVWNPVIEDLNEFSSLIHPSFHFRRLDRWTRRHCTFDFYDFADLNDLAGTVDNKNESWEGMLACALALQSLSIMIDWMVKGNAFFGASSWCFLPL